METGNCPLVFSRKQNNSVKKVTENPGWVTSVPPKSPTAWHSTDPTKTQLFVENILVPQRAWKKSMF